MGRSRHSVIAAVLAVVLAVGLCPVPALAGSQLGAADTIGSSGLTAQDTTRTVNDVTLVQESGVWKITEYSGSATSLNLDSLGVGVITEIGYSAFEGCTSLKTVTLPSTLQRIGSGAFMGCTALQSITLPESLTYIDAHGFKNCTSLSSVTVKSRDLSVYGSYYGVFENAGTGTSSGIAATFTSTCGAVPSDFFAAYSGAPKVTRVTVAAGVREIGGSAFSECSYLANVSLGSGITKIGEYAFSGCSGLSSVALPSALQSIGGSAFLGCTSLRAVTLPESLTSLGAHGFKNCTSLSSVTVKSRELNVYNSYYGVFENAGMGTSSGIAATFTSTCGAVPSYIFAANDGAPKVTRVTVAAGVWEIGGEAFQGCSYLTSVSLPSTITSIGYNAFKDCVNLKSLVIPRNVSADNIGGEAFVNLGLNSTITTTTAAQYQKIAKNSDYITPTRTTVVLVSSSLYRAKVASIAKKAWTGKRIKPTPKVRMGNKVLKKGTDYTLSYTNNKSLGLATVTVRGKGSYTDSKSVTFKIVPAKVKGVKARSRYRSSVTVSWSTTAARKAGASGYRIYYKVAGKKARYVDASWSNYSSRTIYNLTRGKKVTVKVRAYTYINGKKAYGAWSASKSARVKR